MSAVEGTRDLAIDRFRGVAVLAMAAADYIGGLNTAPAFLKHAPDIGLTAADVVAPCFLFAIGLTYGESFRRRREQNPLQAYLHFITRYFALLGIGALLSAGGAAVAGVPSDWGVLQAIGVAGLICLLVIRFRPGVRIAVGLALLCAYQIALDRWLLAAVLGSSHGGFYGAVSWGAMLILASAAADLRRAGRKTCICSLLLLAALSAASAFLTPVSKNRVSASYVLLTLAIACAAYLLIDVGSKKLRLQAGLLCRVGENPLSLYLLHLLLLGFFALPDAPLWYLDAPVWLAALQLCALLSALLFAAWLMHRKKLVIKL